MLTNVITFGPWLVFLLSFCSLKFIKLPIIPENKVSFYTFFLFWLILVQGDSIFLGPLSRLEIGDGEMLFQGYFDYLSKNKNNLFLHDIAGGVDRYSFGRIGGELISGRLFLFSYFPVWLVIVLLRILVTSVAFLSMFFFLKKQFNSSNFIAIACSALFSSSFDFNTSLTFLYGLSIAGLPLLLYFIFNLKSSYISWMLFFLYSILFITFSDPFYWLPSLWITVFLLLLWMKPKSYFSLIFSLIIVSVLWVANYSEAIFSVLQNISLSSRPENFRLTLTQHINWMIFPKLVYNNGGLPYLIPILFTLYVSIKTKCLNIFLGLLSGLILGFMSYFLGLIDWENLGFNFLNSYRWYIEYYAFPITIMVFAKAGRKLVEFDKSKITIKLTQIALCISISLGMIFSFKIETLLHMLTRGNISIYTEISNLKNPYWYGNNNSKVIGVPNKYEPNISSSYNLPSFDGYSTFIPKTNIEVWNKLILKNKSTPSPHSAGLPDLPENNKCCVPYLIEKDINLDILKLMNVGYIISFKELLSSNIYKVSGPEKESKKSFFKRLFQSSDDVFVYKLDEPYARVYSPANVLILKSNETYKSYITSIKKYATKNYAVFFDKENYFENNNFNLHSKLKLVYEQKVYGYDISILSNSSGIVIVNVPYLPWWVAKDSNDKSLKILQVNLGQIAIIVPKNTNKITLKYEKPILF